MLAQVKWVLKWLSKSLRGLSKLILPVFSISPAFAAGNSFEEFVFNLDKTFNLTKYVMVRIAFTCGMTLALMGMSKFKAYKDNPAQFPLSTPIVLLAISSGLMFFPTVVELAGSAVFGPTARPALNIAETLR